MSPDPTVRRIAAQQTGGKVESSSSSSAAELRATVEMCHHCFDTLIHHLQLNYPHDSKERRFLSGLSASVSSSDKPLFYNDLVPDEHVKCPLFVTWEKRRNPITAPWSSHNHDAGTPVYELRGCIGTLSPLPVAAALTKYALIAASQDGRFSPVVPQELSLLRVAVSLLVQYETCDNCYDWAVGVHGIIIKFTVDRQPYSATYLPEVAADQKWDQPTTVASLIRKAGYTTRPITPELVAGIQCTRYKSSKVRITYDEYLQHHQNQTPHSNSSPSPRSHSPLFHFAIKPSARNSSQRSIQNNEGEHDSNNHAGSCTLL